jgi:hypothetical protein
MSEMDYEIFLKFCAKATPNLWFSAQGLYKHFPQRHKTHADLTGWFAALTAQELADRVKISQSYSLSEETKSNGKAKRVKAFNKNVVTLNHSRLRLLEFFSKLFPKDLAP